MTRQQALPESRGLVVLLHGWEGSARSNYILDTGGELLSRGFDVFRLNFRDHGDTHHLNPELFSSNRIEEVVEAVALVQQQYAPRRLAVAGFSLGGNFALRVALRAPAAGIRLDQSCCRAGRDRARAVVLPPLLHAEVDGVAEAQAAAVPRPLPLHSGRAAQRHPRAHPHPGRAPHSAGQP
jgi:pimeloyl-ACP methyl ester carboxylesterase